VLHSFPFLGVAPILITSHPRIIPCRMPMAEKLCSQRSSFVSKTNREAVRQSGMLCCFGELMLISSAFLVDTGPAALKRHSDTIAGPTRLVRCRSQSTLSQCQEPIDCGASALRGRMLYCRSLLRYWYWYGTLHCSRLTAVKPLTGLAEFYSVPVHAVSAT
jgi:hypothetical protein